MARDLYNEVTTRILAQLESGTIPWVKPWRGKGGQSGMMRNAITSRWYSGVNVLLLWMAQDENGWTDSRWLTYKQCSEAGGNVLKGSKGTKIYFMSKFEKESKANPGETVFIPFLKEYTVFNVQQCENLPANKPEIAETVLSDTERNTLCEQFVKSTGFDIRDSHDNRCCYSSAQDHIRMVPYKHFESADRYYSTLFHEQVHMTGHESRLNRNFKGRFGDSSYALEELVAELGASYLCAEFEMDMVAPSAAYIATWITVLKKDSKALFTAASKASKACEFMRDLALRESKDCDTAIAA